MDVFVVMALMVGLCDAFALESDTRMTLAPPQININCGGEAVGRFQAEDPTWLVGQTMQYSVPHAIIGGAEEKNAPMYITHRYGTQHGLPWGYDIPVEQPGTYACTLHFAETYTPAFGYGKRVFHVSMVAYGEPYEFNHVDVFNATGGAQFSVFTLTAPELIIRRTVQIRVMKAAGSPLSGYLSGITCERTGSLPPGVSPVPPPAAAPAFVPLGEYTRDGAPISGDTINLNSGGAAVGRFVAEDPAWLAYGPSTVFSRPGFPIGGADPVNVPGLRDTRYGINGGTWGYQIPIAPAAAGIWDCTLHWAELIATMAIGERVFNVQVQDHLISGFDVIKATNGAEFTAAVLTFYNIPVSDVLVVKFTAVSGDPFLSAITCSRSLATTPAEAMHRLKVREEFNSALEQSH